VNAALLLPLLHLPICHLLLLSCFCGSASSRRRTETAAACGQTCTGGYYAAVADEGGRRRFRSAFSSFAAKRQDVLRVALRHSMWFNTVRSRG